MGTFKLCQMDYALSYVLGLESKPNKATLLGSMVHKALELLAKKRLAETSGTPSFKDDESGGEYVAAEMTVDRACDIGWDAYVDGHPKFRPADKREMRRLVDGVLAGPYSPLTADVLYPEQFFDLELPYDWATYDFPDPHTGERVAGRYRIRGAMDLVLRPEPGVIAYTDWKSGSMRDWSCPNGSAKSPTTLRKDHQLLLYYLALRTLYPDDVVALTIFFAKAVGPITIPFDDSDLVEAESVLRKYFEGVRDTVLPKRIKEDDRWRGKDRPCETFCYWGKTQWKDSGQSVCDHLYGQMVGLGTDRVVAKFGKPNAYKNYGSGGGQTDRDTKPAA
jgi:hypothetical protein